MSPNRIALALGTLSLVLIAGALYFQYVLGYPPCEMCWWQRYPHFAAILVGIGGGLLVRDAQAARIVALLTILCVALSGAIAVYHAGVEWHWWKGPSACTGGPYNGPLDLNKKVVLCDIAAWRFLGISLAGYNAIASLGAAALGFIAWLRK